MNCELIREAISATIDGELVTVPSELVDRHLAGCAACRDWRSRAEVVSRQARISSAAPLDELAGRILAAVNSPDRTGRREWALIRVGLCLVAMLQLAITIPVLILGHDREAPLHVSHEMGSWDAALALGLLLAARRPSRAEGMSALVGVGAALLCITATLDLVAGRTTVMDEAPHLLCVAGWLLLHRLAVLNSLRSPGASPLAVGAPTEDRHAPAFDRRELPRRTAPDVSAQVSRAIDITA